MQEIMIFHSQRAAGALRSIVAASSVFASGLSNLLAASPALEVAALPNQSVRLSWPAVGALRANAPWEHVVISPTLVDGRFSVVVQAGSAMRFFRLRGALPATILETSPALGESGVAVTRETIFHFSGALAADAVVAPSQLFAEFGGRRLLSRAELSSDRHTLTLFYLENLPASARLRVTLNSSGLRDANGLELDADGDGQPGGTATLEFDTLGITGLPGTAVIGHVFASEKTSVGTNLPLAGVTITVDGAEQTLRTTTDASGFFRLTPSPAGRFFVHVDGRTAQGSQWPGRRVLSVRRQGVGCNGGPDKQPCGRHG